MIKERQIIIFDGPDRCGKTEIAKQLSIKLDIPYFKNVDEHQYFLKNPEYFIKAIQYVDTYFTSYLESTNTSVILDRAWPSEWIYSQALNRDTDKKTLIELDERHFKLKTKIIIPFRSNYDNVVDKYAIINKNINNIHKYSMEFADWTRCECLKLNVDDENIDREIQDILNFLNK